MTDPSASSFREFRFGIVAPCLGGLSTWREQIRRIAGHGYSTVLMPDFPRLQPAPAPALAVAASVTDVRVGTWVYAAPFRAPWLTAWEAHSLTVLTDGRFEMGIGVGRPGIEDELRERGLPVPGPGERLDQVRQTVAALRELDGGSRHTPVAMAVSGPKARALAAEIADTVTFAMAPSESRAAVEQRIRDFHSTRAVELSMHVPVVGDAVSPFMAPRPPTPPHCGRPIPWPTCRPTRRRPPTSCVGAGRRPVSPTSPSGRTWRTCSLRSWLSWPDAERIPTEPGVDRRSRRAQDPAAPVWNRRARWSTCPDSQSPQARGAAGVATSSGRRRVRSTAWTIRIITRRSRSHPARVTPAPSSSPAATSRG